MISGLVLPLFFTRAPQEADRNDPVRLSVWRRVSKKECPACYLSSAGAWEGGRRSAAGVWLTLHKTEMRWWDCRSHKASCLFCPVLMCSEKNFQKSQHRQPGLVSGNLALQIWSVTMLVALANFGLPVATDGLPLTCLARCWRRLIFCVCKWWILNGLLFREHLFIDSSQTLWAGFFWGHHRCGPSPTTTFKRYNSHVAARRWRIYDVEAEDLRGGKKK